jgi:Fe-S cluster assembly protein SufB
MTTFDLDLSKYSLGWSDETEYAFVPEKGINENVIEQISWWKGEPKWMRDLRLRSLKTFERKPMLPWFSVNMPDIDFNDIYYYLKPAAAQTDEWDDLPEQMKKTYEKLGIPEAERKYLAGVTSQYDSEVVYHRNRVELEEQGILFCDMDTALREYPDLVKQYFGSVIPMGDNKFAALNTSVWSGGSFIYIPPGVECEMPLQAYFRINSENAGQFERTLIIADEGSKVHYIEGCSAPVYTNDALHSAVVEIVVKPSAHVTYTTIQNWSPNVYNLVTKRARVEAEGHMEWIDGNIGSKLTGEVLSVAYAGPGQHQDAGAKMVHAAPETSSKIVSKSISKDGGITTYRGLVRVEEGATGCKSHVQCDALILDEDSESRTLPYMEVGERDAQIGHEATVSKIADEQLFYLMSRGLTQEQAMGMVVNGFIEPVTRTLPMEYAVEWSRLIELQMEGSVG